MYTPQDPWPPSTSPENPHLVFLMPLPLNSSLCLAHLALCRQWGTTLIYSIKLNVSECGCMCLYVCLLCVMRSTHFPPSCWFPCKSWLTPAKSMRPGPFKPKLLLGWDLSVLATFPPLLALYVSFSLIIFFILICFILIIPRSVGCCSCTQGCAGKGEDNRKQSEHVGGSTKVLTWGRKKTPLRSNL